MVNITRVTDAPLPTPDPWAGQAPAFRCPACGLPEPGGRRCRRCGAATAARVQARPPMTLTLINLAVILFGRGPLLLAIAFLFRPEGRPLLGPWELWLAAALPVFWLAAAGLAMRWRWAWFLALAAAVADLVAVVALQLTAPGHPLLPFSAIAVDLMVLGMLLTIYDEVRVTYAPIAPPEGHAMPKTAAGAYDAGVEHSRAGRWYLAARMWQRAAAMGHHEGRYRRALGLAYLRLGELGAAEAELAAAAALMPADQQTAELIATLARLRRGAAR